MTWINRLIVILIYLIPVLFVPDKILGSIFSKYVVLNFISSIILIFSFLNKKIKKKLCFPEFKYSYYLFFSILIFNIVFSVNKIKTFFYLGYFLYYSLFLLILINLIKEDKDKILKNIFYSGIIPCVLSFYFKIILFKDINTSLVSTFGNQNWFAEYLVLIMFLFFYIKKSIFTTSIFCFYSFCVLNTGSRAGIGVMFLVMVFFLLKAKFSIKKILLLLIALISVSLFFLKDDIKRVSSLNYRLYLVQKSFDYMTENPVKIITGTGFGTYRDIISKYKMNLFLNKKYDSKDILYNDNISHGHNDFIEILIEGGVFFFFFLLYFLYLFFKRYLYHSNYFYKIFYFSLMIFSTVSFPLRLPANFFVFLLITGIFFTDKKNNFKKDSRKIFISTFICFICFIIFSLNIVSYILYYHSGWGNKKNIQSLKLSYYLNPFNREIYNSLIINKALKRDDVDFKKLYLSGEITGFSSKRYAAMGIYLEKYKFYDQALFFYEKAYKGAKRYNFPAKRIAIILTIQKRFDELVDFYEFAYNYEHDPLYLFKKSELLYKINNRNSEEGFAKFIESGINNKKEYIEYLKISYFRLFLLTEKEEYLNKANDIDVKTYIDKDLLKIKKGD